MIDRNRITGGGVTAGIDFGLTLVAHIYGDNLAKEIQLMMEYNPQPPFNSGSPHTADVHIIEKVKSQRESIQKQRKERITKFLNP